MRIVTLSLLAAIAVPALAVAAPLNLTVVHVNDIDRMEADDGRGGIAKLAAIIERERADGGHVLVTHGGDTISPSLLSGIDQGAHMIDLFNTIGIDVMVLGNHEYDFGPEIMVRRVAEAQFPVLSANSMTPAGGLPEGVRDNAVFAFGDWSVGVIGLTTPTTAVRSSPAPIAFGDVTATAAAQADALRADGVDVVIALAHTTISEDEALIAQGAVDFILGGDDHDLRIKWSGGTGFVESNSQANYVTVIDFSFDKDTNRDGGERLVWTADYTVIDTAHIAPSKTAAAAVEGYVAKLDAELNVAIGTTETPLDTRRSSVRGAENAFANLLTDAMREAVGADVAITNGGGIRADREYDAGTTLTRRDILSELPFGNRTVLLEMTGADIVAALENGVSRVEDRAGRFPHVSGMTFRYDMTQPAGDRVVRAMVGDEPLDPAHTYRLATNDFMAGGGDGYGVFQNARVLIDETSGDYMASQLMRHIETAGTVSPTVEGRITRAE
ncbi:MAG: 5'-nucleotidase C-terminal domain-containing protein [Alphaproteobacteria bacterium]|nr:5'-nucleotidase C-terminal domain-containing protein [Alphaproteobacteria bacterium]